MHVRWCKKHSLQTTYPLKKGNVGDRRIGRFASSVSLPIVNDTQNALIDHSMSPTTEIVSAIEHLGQARDLLDKAGADLAAAQVDHALHCLQAQLDNKRFQEVLLHDYSQLDRLIHQNYV